MLLADLRSASPQPALYLPGGTPPRIPPGQPTLLAVLRPASPQPAVFARGAEPPGPQRAGLGFAIYGGTTPWTPATGAGAGIAVYGGTTLQNAPVPGFARRPMPGGVQAHGRA